ncbi:MarR family winged helix-turn-helix transcriptional regulator [Actinoplanes derwentensis]|uniref:DNA-binding transcriptional regulator, MarR family n=1 Tax=Actinoplanes derwentensis TaxID=113562 RepID=A0A1H2CE48_9ACTN|nr:MarR family transcriptional regulator [Actinoplanes derwentensis]GID89944.1 transcriptional regulator [Actinoplanes derwentensis]SDT68614.1 DNA-binding transcriptional regulator, MarR family [Actinoplanes derwentensis]
MHEQETTRLAEEITRLVRMGARFRGMLKPGDLGAEFSALMLLPPLRAMGPLRVTDLAEVKGADPSTVSRQAAQLVKAGLARREADPADGRASRLAVTEAGVAACERVREARVAMLTEVLADWPASRIAAFTDLFHDFNDEVEAHLRTDPGPPPRETS